MAPAVPILIPPIPVVRVQWRAMCSESSEPDKKTGPSVRLMKYSDKINLSMRLFLNVLFDNDLLLADNYPGHRPQFSISPLNL